MTREVLRGKRIVLGVTGSIAAFKAVSVASALTQAGALVDVVMTPEATELIRPLSFQALTQRPVAVEMFGMLNQTEISHVSLGHHADVVCIAPATAHTLAKLALGLADDLVTTTCLATRAPLVIAPAMDADMYDHPAVSANVKTLRERGATIVEPGYGRMASGLVGQGRLAEPPVIVDTLRMVLARKGDLAGWRVVVTAGGTQEAIDPVRYVSNRSSGKMGYAVAEAARDRGASVTLVSTPTALTAPLGVDVRPVVSAADMHDAVMAALQDADVLVMAAAVADYRPTTVAEQKIKKRDDDLTLQLAKTTDILAATASLSSERLVRIGFAAESQDLVSNAADKLERKRLDLIVANDISRSDSGFGTDDNAVVLLDRTGGQRELPLLPKREVADLILDEALSIRQARRTASVKSPTAGPSPSRDARGGAMDRSGRDGQLPGGCSSWAKRAAGAAHFGHCSGGCSSRTGSPQMSQYHWTAIWRTRSERLTMPTSFWPATTGTRRTLRCTTSMRTSSTSASSLTLMMPGDMMSRASLPRRASRSYSLTRPMTAPFASVTGTALILCFARSVATSAIDASSRVQITGDVMISLTFIARYLREQH